MFMSVSIVILPSQHVDVSTSNEAAWLAGQEDSRPGGTVAGKLAETVLKLLRGFSAQ